MSRSRACVTEKNAAEVYQYFLQAIQERRIFDENGEKLAEAAQALVKLMPIREAENNVAAFATALQLWVDTYVSLEKWRRCLATLRQTKSHKKHDMKTIKLSKETFAILQKYANENNMSLRQAADDAIKAVIL